MSSTGPKSSRRAEPRQGWVLLALVCAGALLFGVFVLPRLGGGLEGEVAPDFALPVIFGGEPAARVRLSEQRGKPVLLDFWASWCQPCREQAKVLEAVRAKRPSEFVVLGVNVSDEASAAQRYLAASKPPWVVLEDSQGGTNAAYGVETLPTLVLIGADGKVFAVRRRFVPERELIALLEGLAAQ